MNDTAGIADYESKERTSTPSEELGFFGRLWQFLRRNARKIFYGYAVLVLLVFSFQAVCILIILRPSQEWARFWASFGRSFATSPAAAGICAVIAASIAASQLSKQLAHSKDKAADEAWWQQFEWVTDRIISPGKKAETDNVQLPSSLAFNLMTSLSGSARASFQRDAVGGILNHYLNGSKAEDGSTGSNGLRKDMPDGRTMDAAAFKSLSDLVVTLPAAASAPARSMLTAYEHQEYESEVLRALRHRFDVDFRADSEEIFGADAVVQVENQSIAIDVKLSIRDGATLQKTVSELQRHMALENATMGLIVTRPAKLLNANLARSISMLPENIRLVEWEPDMPSDTLSNRIRSTVGARRP